MSPRRMPPRLALALAAALSAATGAVHATTPQDGLFADQWPLQYNDGRSVCIVPRAADGSCPTALTVNGDETTRPALVSGRAGAGMNVPAGWNVFSPSGQEVVIALLDSGVDADHPDLAGRLWVNPGEANAQGQCVVNGIDDDQNGYVDDCHGIMPKLGAVEGQPDKRHGLHTNTSDEDGHGTMMAGLMTAAANNTSAPMQGGIVGVAGVAPNVKLVTCGAFKFMPLSAVTTIPLAVPVLGAERADLLECTRYFLDLKDRGVNIVVVNLSGGVSRSVNAGNVIYGLTKSAYMMNDAEVRGLVLGMRDRGISVVASAGNQQTDMDNTVNTSIAREDRLYYPAGFEYDHIIGVAATSIHGKLGHHSATSWGRYTIDVGAPGDDILTTRNGGGYGPADGSSPAAALVSGAVAMIRANAATAHLGPNEIRRLLLSTGQPLDTLKRTTASGKLVRLDEALSCSGRSFVRRKLPEAAGVTVAAGASLRMEVENYVCAWAAQVGPIAVKNLATGQTLFHLRDDGTGGDALAGDGIYSGSWTPPSATTVYRLSYGQDSVTGTADVLTVNPQVQVVDNGASAGVAGTWTTSWSRTPFFNSTFLYSGKQTQAGRRWSFTVPEAGRYRISASWPIHRTPPSLKKLSNGTYELVTPPDFGSRAQYVITPSGQASTVVERDQRVATGDWTEIAVMDLPAGTHTVTVKNSQHTELEGDSESVISSGDLAADAIRIERDPN